MKDVIFKSTLREIRQSLGRWLAILAIVALGVGFFTGLKVCKYAFLETGNTYLQAHNFFDYELISTLGLEADDVDAVNALDEVSIAEGSYSTDALINIEGDFEKAITSKFLTISQNINTPSITAGKMPVKSNECLVDARYFSEDDIGKTITIASSNEESTIDMFAYDEYTITGIADSPLYLNFERGSSSVGDGSVSCFILLNEDGFSSEVFTEIYVKLSDSAFIFSDEYNSIRDSAKDALEDVIESCSQRRYDSIIDDAQAKLDDAKAEVEKQKSNIASAEKEIQDNESTLNDGQISLNNAKIQYEQGVSEYNSQKDAAYNELDYYYNSGLITQEYYAAQKSILDAKFQQAWSELSSSADTITAKQAEIDSGWQKIEEAKAELNEAKVKISDAEDELLASQKKVNDIEYPSSYALNRDTNIGYVCFDNDISIVEGIAKVFPLFFFMVAALVCITTMSRMIEEQRTQIGVLKALGYSRNRILGKYVFYSSSSALIGGIIGFFAGTYIFTWVIWEAYKMMYDFADVIFVFDWVIGAIVLLAAIVCAVGATIYSCYHELSVVPAELIRPKAPSAGKRILLEKIPFIWNKLKFLQKVSVRNVFRYKKRFFMMVLGICGCTALLLTGFGVRDSIENVVSMQYDEIYHIDYEVTFNHDLNEEEQNQFIDENKDYIEDCLFAYSGAVDARGEGTTKSVNLIVIDDANSDNIRDFIDLHNGNTLLDYPKAGEGIINSNLATNLSLSVGDELTVLDSDMCPLTITISGLCDNYVYNYLYINEETYASAWGAPEINTAFVLESEAYAEGDTLSSHEIGAILMNSNNVSSVSVSDDFKVRIDNMMKSLDYVIALIIVCAGALAFVVLYNLTNINITERIREIATIKVLGFYPNETAQYVFRENMILTAISALVGIIPGILLHRFVMEKINIDLLSFDVHIAPLSYILSIAGTFIFAAIVDIVMRKKLDKVSMTESLKSIE